jgi:hypothetical protein
MKKKLILLFLSAFLVSCGFSQIIASSGSDSQRIVRACELIKIYEPNIYESMVIHSIIQSYPNTTEGKFSSTNRINNGNFCVLIGKGSLEERSINRLAGTIFHESLHMLFALDRFREGRSASFYDLSAREKKQEEFSIYKRTRELLIRLNTSPWEIREYDDWASPYY